MSKNQMYVEFDSPSWIRRWFMRQDDFTLWCIGFAWVVAQIGVATTIVTIFLKGVMA